MSILSSRTVAQMRIVAVGYTAMVVYLCTYPWTFLPQMQNPAFGWGSVVGRSGWVDVALNTVFYIPLAAAGYCALRMRHRSIAIALLCGLLSFGIEFLQAWLPARSSSLRDATLNIAGALVGIAIGRRLELVLARNPSRELPRGADVWNWALLAAFVVGQIFPGVPFFRIYSLRMAWNGLFETAPLPDVVRISLLTVSAAVLLLQVLRVSRRRALTVAVFCGFFAVRPLFQAAPLSAWEIAAAAVSVGSTVVAGTDLMAKPLGVLLAVYIAFAQFEPFTFVGPPGSFGWAPFAAFFDLPTSTIVKIYATKTFLYGASVYFVRSLGLSVPGSGLLVGGIVAVGELVQRYLPGRTPESTDIVLVAVVTGSLWIAMRRDTRGFGIPQP